MWARLIKDYLTAPDGQTYAIGRGLGLILFFFGILAPSVGFGLIALQDGLTMEGLSQFLSTMVPYLPALTGAVAILVLGTNPTEPSK